MVQYYNLSAFSENTGLISIWQTLSELTNHWFGFLLLILVFSVPLITKLRAGDEINMAFHTSAFYTTIIAIVLFLGQIITSTVYIFIPALIYVVTLGIRWYNKF